VATTPQHLTPENCYICGWPPHADTDPAGHTFCSNAAAAEHFTKEPPVTHMYPGGQTSPEAAYVAQHRPY